MISILGLASTSGIKASETSISSISIVFLIRIIRGFTLSAPAQVLTAACTASLSLGVQNGILTISRMVDVIAFGYAISLIILSTHRCVVTSAKPKPFALPWVSSVKSRTTTRFALKLPMRGSDPSAPRGTPVSRGKVPETFGSMPSPLMFCRFHRR